MKLVCEAPATVANLGPGFDSLALAVDLLDEFELDTGAEPAVVVASVLILVLDFFITKFLIGIKFA